MPAASISSAEQAGPDWSASVFCGVTPITRPHQGYCGVNSSAEQAGRLLLQSAGALGEALLDMGKPLEAETYLKRSYESLLASQQPDSPRVVAARNRLERLNSARQ